MKYCSSLFAIEVFKTLISIGFAIGAQTSTKLQLRIIKISFYSMALQSGAQIYTSMQRNP
jgi:hypothetical protein